MAETKFLDKAGLTKVLENVSTKLNGKSDTFHSHSTHLTTELAASTNLNNVTTPGWYKCSANANAANFTNCPTRNAFALEVTSHAGVCQTLYEYMASGQKIYTRNLYDGTWGAWARVYTTTNKPTLSELGAASSGHTHNYAGSSSAGGSANSAVKLTSSAGSATQPVYFADGVPKATTYTLGKSVPADAKFTDTNTHYASKNVVGASADAQANAAATNGNVYLNSVENGGVTSANKITGSGATTVTSDANGVITISSTNTTYSSLKNPYALTVSLNGNSQGAYDGSATKSINVTASSVGAYTKAETDTKLSAKYANDIIRTKNAVLAAPATADGAAFFRTLTAADIPAVNASAITGTIAAANLPSFVDDVLEGYYNASDSKFYKSYDATNETYSNAYTGETGKIYVNLSDNKTYRWSGSAYVVISETLALGETSSTAYRGDRGKTAYDHATAHGSAFVSGLYKITTNSAGHVTAATAVTKSDITALGIPGQDTNTVYTHPTTSGNKHIPAGGSSGQILRWYSDGTATWGSDNNTWIAFKGATTDAAGTAGYAPAPAAGAANRYLRSDGTWVVPPNTTYSDMKGATSSEAGTHGLVPAPAAGKQASFLRGDGTWAVPTNTDTKVTQTAIADVSTYTNWRTVNFGASNSATEDFAPSTVTDGVYTSKNLSFQPSSGTLKATKFKGALNGTADIANKLGTATVGSGTKPIYLNAGVATASSSTVGSGTKPVYMNGGTITECGSSLGVSITGNAATATKATKDSADQQITTTYIKNISISGQNVTVTKGDGSTFPLTTQDTKYAALTNDEVDACFTEVFG